MSKTLPTAAFILALWFSAVAGAHFVGLAHANPYMYYEVVSPPADASPLVISISSPKNNTIYRVNNINLTFNLNTQNTSINYLLGAYFKADWMQENVTVYKQSVYSPEFPEFWSYNETFWNLPDGEYSVVITARGDGGYAEGLTYNFFQMTTNSLINFTIDTTPPSILSCSVEHKTYSTPDVPLTLTINEAVSQVSYSLDGQRNVTAAGNTTLTGLSIGDHNVVVYATDLAGHVGTSETITFTISKPELTEPEPTEPEPTELELTGPEPTEAELTEAELTEALLFTTTDTIIIVAVTVAVVLRIGLLVFFNRRKN